MTHPLNRFVWCKLGVSPIHGVGVFAIQDIPEGTLLSGGHVIYSRKNEETLLPEISNIIQDHHSRVEFYDKIPNPNFDVSLQSYMNHSYVPNSNGTVALRDIKKGEEVTEDYTNGSYPLGDKGRAHFTFL